MTVPTMRSCLNKLASNKTGQSEEAQVLMSKYSESTVKLEEILNCIKSGKNEDSFLKIIKLKEDHGKHIKNLKNDYENQISDIKQIHKEETKKLLDRIKELENKAVFPEVCEIDLSSALTGLNTSCANDYGTHRSGRLNTKESNKGKERMTSLEICDAATHSKSKNKANFLPIKSIKNNLRCGKVSLEEYEKLKKKSEKQKGLIANQKINEKKLKSDNTMLSHKIQSLNKEINELKHRLNKLIKVDKKMTSSKKKNRLGSHMSRGVKNAFETKKLFGNRKLSHACKSPKMKKVLSNRALIESRVGNAFGRRETLDINKSGSLLNLGLHEDKNHRISEITNIMTSDEDISSNYVPKDDRSVTQNSSRNKLGRCGSTQNQLARKKLAESKSCNCSELYQDQQIMRSNYNTTSSQVTPQQFGNSCTHNWDPARQSMENELMNHVSNAVSSFLSMHEAKARHARGNSKSDIGFTNPGDYGQLECTNEYENEYIDTTLQSRDHHCLGNNVLTEYNGCNKDRKRGNHSTKRKKQVCKYYISHCLGFHQNNLKNQYSNDQSLYNTETQAEIFLNDMNKRHNSKPKHNEMFGQRSFSSRGPVISSHLMGLNKLMKRKVSPIQRDEVDRLMTSGNSIFESWESQNKFQYWVKQSLQEEDDEESNLLHPWEESLKETSNEMMTLTIDEGLQDNPPGDSTGSEDDQQMDENIEMERIAKMNFYAFKSIDKEGIVGMWQDIKKNKSPNTKSQLPTRAESGMSSKYKSFLNKSVNDCGNLMISNSLLKPKDTNSTREQLHYIDVPFSKRPQL